MLLKLAPTENQHQALLDTMHAFNAACNYIAQQAFEAQVANKFELQKMTYGEVRTTYHLPAQLAIRAISKTSDTYKRDKSVKPSFRPEGAIVYDERVMSFKGLTILAPEGPCLSNMGMKGAPSADGNTLTSVLICAILSSHRLHKTVRR